jgi:hypothetical protein
MSVYRTVLEQMIRERRQTFEEFAADMDAYAREHGERGTLSLRHLQRLACGPPHAGREPGQVRPATARLLEGMLGLSVDDLLAPPGTDDPHGRMMRTGQPESRANTDLDAAFHWLDEQAGWRPGTSQRRAAADLSEGGGTHLPGLRADVRLCQLADAMAEYYRQGPTSVGAFTGQVAGRGIATTVLSRPEWLDLNCAITDDQVRLTLDATASDVGAPSVPEPAVERLAAAASKDVRLSNSPLYRLLRLATSTGAIMGAVGVTPFVEYALTMDLLEGELVDAIVSGKSIRPGHLPLRDRYLPDTAAVLKMRDRLCAGGVLALTAIARPGDRGSGGPDYALVLQRRSEHVLNSAQKLSVIPKAFHQPLADVRADAQLWVTLERELEEELFGRQDVDSTIGDCRAAVPMHRERLSEPMRWLTDEPGRMRMECTGFGLNLVSGNYEFASLVVIEDEEFWTRFGGRIEANWEASGLYVYSTLDAGMLMTTLADESWSPEGLFACFLGLRRLRDLGSTRVNLPHVDWTLGSLKP